jgi:hypothetical protein
MKKHVFIFSLLLVSIYLNGQEKELPENSEINNKQTETKQIEKDSQMLREQARIKRRIRALKTPDSLMPNYFSLQPGISSDGKGTNGGNITFTYEKKLPSNPFAWFTNYTYGGLFKSIGGVHSDAGLPIGKKYGATESIAIHYNHFGGGLHYYFWNYDRNLKLYTGIGALLGVNSCRKNFKDDGEINSDGIDYGGYGLIGLRWIRGHLKVGAEYRIGGYRTSILSIEKTSGLHELNFSIGYQF